MTRKMNLHCDTLDAHNACQNELIYSHFLLSPITFIFVSSSNCCKKHLSINLLQLDEVFFVRLNYTSFNSIILISIITLKDERFTCFHANFYTNLFIYYRENTRKPPKASELRHSTSKLNIPINFKKTKTSQCFCRFAIYLWLMLIHMTIFLLLMIIV